MVGDRLVRSMEIGVIRHGIAGFMPDDEQLSVVRAWLALCELARADDELAGGVADTTMELQRALAGVGRVHPGDTLTLDTLTAIVTGLWVGRCDRVEPIPAASARAVLRHACAAMGVGGEPEAA
jgi:hypothetical protein